VVTIPTIIPAAVVVEVTMTTAEEEAEVTTPSSYNRYLSR